MAASWCRSASLASAVAMQQLMPIRRNEIYPSATINQQQQKEAAGEQ